MTEVMMRAALRPARHLYNASVVNGAHVEGSMQLRYAAGADPSHAQASALGMDGDPGPARP